MAHTKGKWKVTEPGVFDSPLIYRYIKVDSGTIICQIHDKASGEEPIANAKLIAAAPDLLEALQLALIQFQDLIGASENSNDVKVIKIMRKAIKKATQLDNQK